MTNVIPLGNVTRLDIPTDTVLEQSKGICSEGVVIMGFDDDGEPYFASSIADGDSPLVDGGSQKETPGSRNLRTEICQLS